ncbi:MAG: DUF6673 family protein [Oscillospiraceae bacterium]
MIKINDSEFDFSFFNPRHLKVYEEGRKTVAEKYAAIGSVDPATVGMDEYINVLTDGCNAIFELFDSVFGNGASNKIFGEQCDFEKCVDAYTQFEDEVSRQAERFGKKVERFTPNRSTRK